MGPGPRLPVYPDLYKNRHPKLPVNYQAKPGLRDIKLHEIDFYVTMKCNLRCQFCSVRAGEYDHKDLPLDRCLELIDEACALGLQELHFLGGEPTLRTDLEDMVEYAVKRGVSTRVITNGMLLDRERIKTFIDIGLQELMVSVDGTSANHQKLRKCNASSYDRTMQCLSDAIDLGLRTRMAATAYKDNYDDMLPLMQQAYEMKVDRFSIFLGSPLGRGHDMQTSVISPYDWRDLQNAVARASADYGKRFSVIMEQGFQWKGDAPIDRSALKGRGTGCNSLLEDFDYLIIRSDGALYQCVFFMTEGDPIGDVWEAPLKESLQYALEVKKYEPFTHANDKCVSCHHQKDCGTGCRGYAHLLADDWIKTDPRCSKTAPEIKEAPEYFPLCPILKWNARTGSHGGSSEQALDTAEA